MTARPLFAAGSRNCGEASVRDMEQGGSKLAAEDGSCPVGTSPERLTRESSCRWCVRTP